MAESQITVYYDGLCPLCVREIRWLRKKNTKGEIHFEDYNQSECEAASRYGLTRSDLHRAIHGVKQDGTILRGMAVFREIYGLLGMGWLTRPTGWPVLKWIFDGLYWCFARIRPLFGRLSGQCKDDSCSI